MHGRVRGPTAGSRTGRPGRTEGSGRTYCYRIGTGTISRRSRPNRADSVSDPVIAAWPRRRIRTTVDAQSRGRADEIDPADQWVLNPRPANTNCDWTIPHRSRRPGPRRAAAPSPTRTPAHRQPSRPPPVAPRPRGTAAAQAPRRAARGAAAGAARTPAGASRSRKAKKALLWTGGMMAFVLVAGCGAARTSTTSTWTATSPRSTSAGAGAGGFKQGRGRQHPHHRHGQAHRQGQRGLRRQGQRRATPTPRSCSMSPRTGRTRPR